MFPYNTIEHDIIPKSSLSFDKNKVQFYMLCYTLIGYNMRSYPTIFLFCILHYTFISLYLFYSDALSYFLIQYYCNIYFSI